VLVCLNGEINAASEVTKIYSDSVDTFQSLDFGSLGFVQNGRVVYNRLPRKLEILEADNINTNVDLITVYAGMDEKFFKFSADSGVDGIVVEALGIGNVPPKAFYGIKYAVEKGYSRSSGFHDALPVKPITFTVTKVPEFTCIILVFYFQIF
jgi:L-asparaginase